MNFDINLILVPITLVFLLVWLVDKVALKKQHNAKLADKKVQLAHNQLSSSQDALKDVLRDHQITTDIDNFKPSDDTPQSVQECYQRYHLAKQNLASAKIDQEAYGGNFLIRWSYEFLPILVVIVLVRSFIVEPFNIPSSSMVPTLYTGDFIVVNKSSYGLRLPLTHTKILDLGSPKRGDVAVFRYPMQPKIYYIKRVIGLPNDTVAYKDGVLSINGQAVATQKTAYHMNEEFISKLLPARIEGRALSDEERTKFGQREETFAHYYQETLGDHQYRVRYLGNLNTSQDGQFLQQNAPEVITSQGREWAIVVPEGHYFVMGDNRDDSKDSRYWGFVPEENLSGKATYIWMHKDAGFKLPSFNRMGAID
ncbi:signal peptidase I [Moraxella sp. Tifton1]|uniref:signal peptidase I n=1 Tax=Moraxella oculi TaxID=2940516 RepID=UPI002012CEE7|nr:signal peptidase I [Moraxella sp. Tifton1]MCL1623507.1 signal peptidase I [Moraxella sp. Tifton1]